MMGLRSKITATIILILIVMTVVGRCLIHISPQAILMTRAAACATIAGIFVTFFIPMIRTPMSVALTIFQVCFFCVSCAEKNIDLLGRVGFELEMYLIPSYTNRCKAVSLAKATSPVSIGLCEIIYSWPDEAFHCIIYDTSGEILLGSSRRSKDWVDAIEQLPMGKTITKMNIIASPIFGPFYDVIFGPDQQQRV